LTEEFLDLDHILRVRVDVDESDVAKLRVGQSAYVTADAYGDRRFTGRVVRIGIPKVLNNWTLAPFFRTYLEALGLQKQNVVFSDETSEEMWQEGGKYGSIDPCYPSKVAQAHIHNLLFHHHTDEKKLHYIFFPCITHVNSELEHLMELLEYGHRLVNRREARGREVLDDDLENPLHRRVVLALREDPEDRQPLRGDPVAPFPQFDENLFQAGCRFNQ
jgi:hypothetical protein